jgi:hypothetical protein
MKRILAGMVAMAVMVAVGAGIAVAANFQCADAPCNGTNNPDTIKERQGSNHDEIAGRFGGDTIRANLFGSDNDIIDGNQNNDLLRTDDGDSRDAIDCGSGANDVVIVDSGDAVNFSNCEDVRGGEGQEFISADGGGGFSEAIPAK